MRVAICSPAYSETKALFTLSLVQLVIWSLSQPIVYNGKRTTPKITTHFVGSLARVDVARNLAADQALKENPDYLLWLDVDHVFPQHALMTLAAHDLFLVGCNYRKRTVDAVISSAANVQDGELEPILPRKDGVEPVDLVGFGVCLVKAPVFERLPRPWFVMGPHGEDGYFCEQARKAGIQPHVDHALSMEVGHIAETVLRFPS